MLGNYILKNTMQEKNLKNHKNFFFNIPHTKKCII